LNRLRRIWICFPPDYFTTENYYPVVYMHDGQNVFNAGTSFAGEWEVDEAMQDAVQQACSNAIVVAIDNGGGNRLDEYAPWLNTQYNEGGQGGQYVDFIVNTLKPYIDDEFRTLPQKENTAIIGSSLGGLISAYAIFTYPEVFGRAGIFSPAYWFNPQIFDLAASHTAGEGNKIYHVCGTSEGNGSVLTNQNQMISLLEGNGYGPNQLLGLDDPNGAHSEWFWREEFPAAYTWLIDCAALDVTENAQSEFRLFPNPSDSVVKIESEEKIISYSILHQNGQLVQNNHTIQAAYTLEASVESLVSGTYFIVLHLESGKRSTLRLIKK
jgi:predicted alpha/beta superfamily hydrolase